MKLLFSILVVLFICLVIVPGSTYSFAKEDNTKEVQLPVPEFLEQLLESLENKINSTAQYVVNSLDDVLIRFVSHVATNEQLVDKLTEKVVDSLSNKKHEVLLGEIASTVIEKLIQDKFLDKVAHHLTSQVVMRMSEDKMKNNLQKVVSNSIDINSLVSTSLNSFFEAMNKPQNKEPIVEAVSESLNRSINGNILLLAFGASILSILLTIPLSICICGIVQCKRQTQKQSTLYENIN